MSAVLTTGCGSDKGCYLLTAEPVLVTTSFKIDGYTQSTRSFRCPALINSP